MLESPTCSPSGHHTRPHCCGKRGKREETVILYLPLLPDLHLYTSNTYTSSTYTSSTYTSSTYYTIFFTKGCLIVGDRNRGRLVAGILVLWIVVVGGCLVIISQCSLVPKRDLGTRLISTVTALYAQATLGSTPRSYTALHLIPSSMFNS